MPRSHLSLIAKLALFTATIIWGSTFVILKNTIAELPIYFVLTVRFLLAPLILGAIMFKSWKNFSWSTVWRGGVTGIVLAAAYVTQTIGLKYTTPGTNAFLTATYSVMVPFMMWAFTRRKPTVFNVVAAILGVVGVGLVSFDGSFSSFNFMGEGMTLLCGVAFALQIICIATIGKGQDATQFTIFELLSCGLCMLVLYLALEYKEPIVLSGDAIFNLSYLTIMGTAVALFIMTWGMKYASASSSALIMSLEAVFGVIFSIIFYNEKLTWRVGIGFAVIFIAVIVSEYLGAKFVKKTVEQSCEPPK